MAALAQSTSRKLTGSGKRMRTPGTNAVTFYAGSFVRIDRATGLVVKPAATSTFVGFGICERQVTADGAAGRNEVEAVWGDGNLELDQVAITGLDNQNDVGDPVWASDDNTLTLTDDTVSTPVGIVTRYYGDGTKGRLLIYPTGTDQAL